MGMTFANMKIYLKFQFGNRTDLEDVSDLNLYETWINSAYTQLCSRNRFWALKRNFKFPQLQDTDTSQSTTDATAYLSVPSDALVIQNIQDTTNDRDLDYIKPGAYFAYTDRSDTDAEGQPTEYTRSGSKLYLHPTPDATYTTEILYRKRPATLSGTEETAIDEEWDDAILALAAFMGFSWLHEYDKAEARKNEFIGLVSGLIGLYDQEEKGANDTYQMKEGTKEYGFD